MEGESLFLLFRQTDLPPSTITAELSKIKQKIDKTLYESASEEGRSDIHAFLWKDLPSIWETGAQSVKLSVSSTLGMILIKLAPYFAKELMMTLQDSLMYATSGALLLISSFAYLSKFFFLTDVVEIVENTPLLHFFSGDASEHLPTLVKEVLHLPKSFLKALAEYLLSLSLKSPTNRQIPKAICVIADYSPDILAELVSPGIPLTILATIFPNSIPRINDDYAYSILNECIEKIENFTNAIEFEAACIILTNLIDRGYSADIEKVSKFLNNSKFLIKLPVNSELIITLFSQTNIILSNSRTLLKNHPTLAPRLTSLISESLDINSDFYSLALKSLSESSEFLNSDVLEMLLDKVLSITSQNWVHHLWTLELIRQLDFSKLSKNITGKALDSIETAAVSKFEKLREMAVEVIVAIKPTMPMEGFRLFLDEMIRKIDIFESEDFELRLNFISRVFIQFPGSWTLTFLPLAALLSESLGMPGFPMLPALQVMSVFVSNFQSASIDFSRLAVSCFVNSYTLFTGKAPELPKTSLFEGFEINEGLTQCETDLIVSAETSHRSLMRLAEASARMLSRVQWNEFALPQMELEFLLKVAELMLPLFTEEANTFASSLFESDIDSILPFLEKSEAYSNTEQTVISFTRLIAIAAERHSIFYNSLNVVIRLQSFFFDQRNLDFLTVMAVKHCVPDLSNEILERVIEPSQKYLLNSMRLSEVSINSPMQVEVREPLDKIDLSTLPPPEAVEAVEDEEDMEDETSDFRVNCIPSLTPIVLLKKLKKNEGSAFESFLTLAGVRSLVTYSRLVIPGEVLLTLFEYAIKHSSTRTAYAVMKGCIRLRYRLPIENYLCSTIAHTAMLPQILSLLSFYKGFNKLPEKVRTFLNNLIPPDICQFALTANRSNRRLSIALIKFDVDSFLTSLSQTKLKRKHLLNLSTYIQNINMTPKIIEILIKAHRLNTKPKLNLIYIRLLRLAYTKHKDPLLRQHLISQFFMEISADPLCDETLVELAQMVTALDDEVDVFPLALTLVEYFPKNSKHWVYLSEKVGNLIEFSDVFQMPLSSDSLSVLRIINDRNTFNSSDKASQANLTALFKFKPIQTASSQMRISNAVSRLIEMKPPKDVLKQAFNYLCDNVNFFTSPHLMLPVYSTVLKMVGSRSSIAARVLHDVSSLFDMAIVPPQAIGIMCRVCAKMRDHQFGVGVFIKHLKLYTSYSSHMICEAAALVAMSVDESPEDAGRVVPLGCNFYDVFYATVSVGKKGLKHEMLNGLFDGAADEAIKMLDDEARRPFSVFYAFVGENDVPEDLSRAVEMCL